MTNPFFETTWMPQYDRMTPDTAREALEKTLPEATAALAELEAHAKPTWQDLMVGLTRVCQQISRIWGTVHHLLAVVNSDAWRKLEEDFQGKIIDFYQHVAQSQALYACMTALQDADMAQPCLTPVQRRILEKHVLGAKLSGVALQGKAKEEFNANEQQIAQLGVAFNNNVLDSVKAWSMVLTTAEEIDGLKPDYLAQAAERAGGTPDKGPWKITLDVSSYSPFMEYATHRASREKLQKAFSTRASQDKQDNAPIIEKLLKLYKTQAKLLGYAEYAEVSLAQKMAPSVQAIEQLLGELATKSRPAAEKEVADLYAFAKAQGFAEDELQPWDVAFWAARQREAIYNFDAEALRPYFPLEYVMKGMFALIERLFGVRFEQVTGDIHAWHKDVRFYHVKDATGALVAGLYFDPYTRTGTKNGGAWMNEVHTRDFETGAPVLPIALIVCNQMPPLAGKDATMNLYEMETLFHETGHALQEMLTTVDTPFASGINNVEWDAVEIASQFFEQFAMDKQTLQSLSKHVETGETLPDALYQRIYAARNYRAGNAMLRQIYFALTDLGLYSAAYPGDYASANAFKDAIGAKILPKPPADYDRFLNAFTHIFCGGYNAGYYSYKWSETLSADIFMAFQEVGMDNTVEIQKLGRRYRETFLALGGSIPPGEVFKAFRGRDPDTSAILKLAGLIQ